MKDQNIAGELQELMVVASLTRDTARRKISRGPGTRPYFRSQMVISYPWQKEAKSYVQLRTNHMATVRMFLASSFFPVAHNWNRCRISSIPVFLIIVSVSSVAVWLLSTYGIAKQMVLSHLEFSMMKIRI